MVYLTFHINKNNCTKEFIEGFLEDLWGEYSDGLQEEIMTKYLEMQLMQLEPETTTATIHKLRRLFVITGS